MRSGGGGKLVSLVFLVALVLAAALMLRDLDPAYRAGRASEQQAKAAAAWPGQSANKPKPRQRRQRRRPERAP